MSSSVLSLPANTAPSVSKVVANFIKGASVMSKPGFCHSMRLSYNTMDMSRLSGDSNSLTYRYKLSPDIPKFSVGLLTALMDELSTDACFHVGSPSQPGLSLQMQTELVSGVSLQNYDELDIVNVVTKLGKTISFTRTDIKCPETEKIVAFCSHVKYMPTGSFISDLVFTNRFASDLYQRMYLDPAVIPEYDKRPLFDDVIANSLKYDDANATDKATFKVSGEHVNPFGSLHGGCHAMVMEQAAENYVKAQLGCDNVALEYMQVEYLGAGKGTLEVECKTIGKGTDSMQVQVELKKGNRVSSRGTLRLATAI